jgi:phosphatidylglycerophosphatase A
MKMARLIAAGGGAGFFPVAPGTAGSVVGVALGVGLLAVSPWALLAGAVAAACGGVVATRAATGLGWRGADKNDPGWIVIDEIAGQMIALLALPRPSWLGVALAFALFRLFDIWKPGPVGWADRQGGAFGVMADDVIAGAIAFGILVLARASF